MKLSIQSSCRKLQHLTTTMLLGGIMFTASAMAHGGGSTHQSDDLEHLCLLAAMLGASVSEGCGQVPVVEDPGLSPETIADLEDLYRAVAPFYNYDVALASGWNVAISDCVESPMGGMGYHYANISQLGNGGKLSLLRPEALLYIPREDGSMEFVGVEYIIPEADWPYLDAPVFLEQHLHFNPHVGIWALHVWIARFNPEGIFADWNPEVSCAFAPD